MFNRHIRVHEIAPEEIFLDSTNLPRRDDLQFEGRVVSPVSAKAILGVGIVFGVVAVLFIARSFDLGIAHGSTYAEVSRENRLDHSLVFATRGPILDRTGSRVAWNEIPLGATSSPFSVRTYLKLPGLSHLIGFVQYPKADKSGAWWRTDTLGMSGVELIYNDLLKGINGSTMVEIDAKGNVEEQNIIEPPQNGKNVQLSIDAEVQSKMFEYLSKQAKAQGFEGGAGVIMDIRTGELLALVSFPEYDNAAFSAGDAASIRAASNDGHRPLLNRAVSGLYAPGSIVKPIFAAAALNEHVIAPDTKVLSKGAITLPNPYDPSKPSVFRDWTVHGLVDMREAIAVSSDEYFYTIGGGYGSQAGLGVKRLDEYARKFGLGRESGIELRGEEAGVIPTPEWKAEVFGPDDPWRIGDTYHTAIGQYGFQVTPIQAVRFVSAIGNGGTLLTPQLIASSTPKGESVGIPDEYLKVVREGMRLAVVSTRSDATVRSLNIPGIKIAAKTGTAEVGTRNQFMNSWSVGFWPSDAPRFAYAAVLEKAPAGTLSGAAPGLRPFFEWLIVNKPEYVE